MCGSRPSRVVVDLDLRARAAGEPVDKGSFGSDWPSHDPSGPRHASQHGSNAPSDRSVQQSVLILRRCLDSRARKHPHAHTERGRRQNTESPRNERHTLYFCGTSTHPNAAYPRPSRVQVRRQDGLEWADFRAFPPGSNMSRAMRFCPPRPPNGRAASSCLLARCWHWQLRTSMPSSARRLPAL